MPEVLLLIVLVLMIPISALILAIGAYNRANRLAREVRRMATSLSRAEQRLADLATTEADTKEEPEAAEEPASSAATSQEEADGGDEVAPAPTAVSEASDEASPATTPSPPTDAADASAETPSSTPDVSPPPIPVEALKPKPEAPSIPAAAARRPLGLEELLSTKVIVWIAAVAVALSGVFLVRYFVEQGLLTEPMKVGLAALLGVSAIISGEVVRRRNMPGIAQGLVAAGVPCLYAAILGLVHYDLAPASVGLGLLALCTAAVVALSLRHGALVATLGLIGGFLMPALIGAHTEPPMQLFGYMLLLQVGLISLARHRTWWWLTVPALLAGFLWATVWILTTDNLDGRMWVSLFLAASAGAFVYAAGSLETKDDEVRRSLGWLAVAPALTLSAVLAHAGSFTNFDWFQLGAMCAAALVLARLRPLYVGVPWIGAGLVVILLTSWAGGIDVFFYRPQMDTEFRERWTLVAALLGGLFALGSYLCLWKSGREHVWTRLCAFSGVGFLSLIYIVVQPTTFGLPWWGWGLIGASAYALLAAPVAERRSKWQHGNAAFGNLCVAASALVALSVWWGVGQADGAHRSWITIAWGLELPVLALLAVRLELPKLITAAKVLALLIGVRLLSNALVFPNPVGDGLIFNWLLYGYAVPAIACFAVAGIVRKKYVMVAHWFSGGGIWTLFAMATLLIRNGFADVREPRDFATLFEYGTFATLWGCYGLLLIAIGHWRRATVAASSGLLIFAASLATAVMGCGLIENPLGQAWPIGDTRIFNGLLFLYGVPALLSFIGARLLHYTKHSGVAVGWSGICGLVLTFGLVTLQVRHFFVGSVLAGPAPTNAEAYAYSAAWIAFALVLLGVALTVRTPIKAQIRWGSLAVMLAAVGKVFLYDLSELQDLWRVVSFLGLGVTLFAVSLLYQKFVFTSGRKSEPDKAATAEAVPEADPKGSS